MDFPCFPKLPNQAESSEASAFSAAYRVKLQPSERVKHQPSAILSNSYKDNYRRICVCFQEQPVDRIKPNQYDANGMETNHGDLNQIKSERTVHLNRPSLGKQKTKHKSISVLS